MRDNDRVTLLIKVDGEPHYDPALGRRVGGEVIKKIVSCNISEQGIELSNMLAEKLDLDRRVVRLRHDVKNISKVFISDKAYRVVTKRNRALYVEELSND
ncbi:hypothetical protein ACFKJ4_06520 [Streptococcus agalactiae]|uniref:hypothetical protein n=1 Tax=Streptococcus agalactiae TaxID=1311 RepID=UPI0022F07890|nr:hypothetical protein [Streptococcus agalactiae]MCD0093154.1 hypothetical protein [Streptococcus agalactiae]MCD0097797.1 hypothetical protein [Streptococcus agalactiae]